MKTAKKPTPWTPEQWNKIRAAGDQYDKDVKAPWAKARADTAALQEAYGRAKVGGNEAEAARCEEAIRQHPSMVEFFKIQKQALARRSAAFPKA